jgi:hypothetical protein
MWLIKRWHERNMRNQPEVMKHLMDVAKNDNMHG